MDNLTLVKYLNTFCNWLIKVSFENNQKILVCDENTRTLFYLIHKKGLDESDLPYISISEIAIMAIEYHNELLHSEFQRQKQIKKICKEIYPILLEQFKKMKLNISNNEIIQSTLLFDKSTKLIQKYMDYYSYEVEVEDISNYV